VEEDVAPAISVLKQSNNAAATGSVPAKLAPVVPNTTTQTKARVPRKKGVRQTAQEKVSKAKQTEILPPFLDKLQYDDITRFVIVKRQIPLTSPQCSGKFVLGLYIKEDEKDECLAHRLPILDPNSINDLVDYEETSTDLIFGETFPQSRSVAEARREV